MPLPDEPLTHDYLARDEIEIDCAEYGEQGLAALKLLADIAKLNDTHYSYLNTAAGAMELTRRDATQAAIVAERIAKITIAITSTGTMTAGTSSR